MLDLHEGVGELSYQFVQCAKALDIIVTYFDLVSKLVICIYLLSLGMMASQTYHSQKRGGDNESWRYSS